MNNKDSMLGTKRPSPDVSPNASARMGGLSVIPSNKIESPKPQEVKLEQLLPQLAQKPQVQNQPNVGALPKLLAQETPKFLETVRPDTTTAVNAKPSFLNVKLAPQENMQPSNMSIVESIMQKENVQKALDTNLQKSKEEQMSRQTINKLQPAFQRIEEILSYQGQMNKAKMDYNSEHYTVAPSQSLFNLTANQIGNMPTWRQ